MLKLLTDENFNGDILRGLRRRLPELDAVRVQDVELSAAGDCEILEWASAAGRILLTHDRETVPDFVYERIRSGQTTPGVFLVNDEVATGRIIEDLVIAIECLPPDECRDLVTYFPL